MAFYRAWLKTPLALRRKRSRLRSITAKRRAEARHIRQSLGLTALIYPLNLATR